MAKGSIDDSLGQRDAYSWLSALGNPVHPPSTGFRVRLPIMGTGGNCSFPCYPTRSANILRGDRTKIRCHNGHSVYCNGRGSDSRGIVRCRRGEVRSCDRRGDNSVPAVSGGGDQSGEHSVQERMRPQRVQEIQRIIRSRPGCQKFRRVVTVDHRMGVGGIGSIPTNQGHRNVVMTAAACGPTCRFPAWLWPGHGPVVARREHRPQSQSLTPPSHPIPLTRRNCNPAWRWIRWAATLKAVHRP